MADVRIRELGMTMERLIGVTECSVSSSGESSDVEDAERLDIRDAQER